MTIPDYISPIVAYRVWQLDGTGLRSLNGEPWLPGKPLAAGCQAPGVGTRVGRLEKADRAHDAPAASCTCGVYAAKTFVHLRSAGYTQYGIHGEVYLWGTVVDHKLGWRAQFAYPKSLVLPLEMLPWGMGRLATSLQRLAAYGCNISVAGKQQIVPLWSLGSGYDASGLDLLMRRCQGWYARREEERRVKCGDRLTVLGCGIAVIEQVAGDCVHALLWNRSRVRIGRLDILWDAGNMRWEAKHRDAVFETSARSIAG